MWLWCSVEEAVRKISLAKLKIKTMDRHLRNMKRWKWISYIGYPSWSNQFTVFYSHYFSQKKKNVGANRNSLIIRGESELYLCLWSVSSSRGGSAAFSLCLQGLMFTWILRNGHFGECHLVGPWKVEKNLWRLNLWRKAKREAKSKRYFP